MLGGYSVGKTSLIRRFVHSKFSEDYLTTIGVKVDKKSVHLERDGIGHDLDLMLWDIAGEDDFFSVPDSYLRGAHGLFFVVDSTRVTTVDPVLSLNQRAQELLGDVPRLIVLNKCDLEEQLQPNHHSELQGVATDLHTTSAKDGTGVESAFVRLATNLLS